MPSTLHSDVGSGSSVCLQNLAIELNEVSAVGVVTVTSVIQRGREHIPADLASASRHRGGKDSIRKSIVVHLIAFASVALPRPPSKTRQHPIKGTTEIDIIS